MPSSTNAKPWKPFPAEARRDDIRPGLRITNYKGRAVIAFNVSGTLVAIIGIFYGDQDYETELNPPDVDATPDSGTNQ